jgi:hypothetical protein
MKKFGQHFRGNIVGYVALFVALGGVSYAAVTLPAGSVGTKQLKRNAVISSKVKNGSLLRNDFKAGQLPRGATGSAGVQGPTGPQGVGVTGPQGPGATRLQYDSGPTAANPTTLATFGSLTLSADCTAQGADLRARLLAETSTQATLTTRGELYPDGSDSPQLKSLNGPQAFPVGTATLASPDSDAISQNPREAELIEAIYTSGSNSVLIHAWVSVSAVTGDDPPTGECSVVGYAFPLS